jgi:hypothetical protein
LEEKRIELDGHLREVFTGLGYRWGAKPGALARMWSQIATAFE